MNNLNMIYQTNKVCQKDPSICVDIGRGLPYFIGDINLYNALGDSDKLILKILSFSSYFIIMASQLLSDIYLTYL